MDDENYYADRHDGLRMTTDGYKDYFLKSPKKQLNTMAHSPVQNKEMSKMTSSPRGSLDYQSKPITKPNNQSNEIRSTANMLFAKEFKDLTNI